MYETLTLMTLNIASINMHGILHLIRNTYINMYNKKSVKILSKSASFILCANLTLTRHSYILDITTVK